MKIDWELFRVRLMELAKTTKQTELAAQLQSAGLSSMDESKLSRLFNGNGNIKATELVAIADKYHCSIDYLLGRDSVAEKGKPITTRDVCRMFAQILDNFDLKMEIVKRWDVIIIGNDKKDIPDLISEFLEKYYNLQKVSGLSEEDKKTLIEKYLNEVPEYVGNR